MSASIRLGQLAGVRIARKHHHILCVLIGRNQPLLRRINREVSRILTAASDALHKMEPSACRIDGEDDQHIFSAVGGIQKAAGAIDVELGPGALSGKGRVAQRHLRQPLECAVLRIPRQHIDTGGQLVDR